MLVVLVKSHPLRIRPFKLFVTSYCLLPEESMNVFPKMFLIELEYFVDKSVESDLKVKFLQSFSKHMLLKFIGFNKKFNPHHVKAFYCNLELTHTVLVCKFKDRIIKFEYIYFNAHFGLKFVGMNVCVVKSLDYDRISFVQSILKSVFGDRLDMDNFHISQVKLEMRTIHWIIVKIFYPKPRNWARTDDFNLYLKWALLHCNDINWVKFVVERMFRCKDNPNRSSFFTLFV